MAGGSRNRNSFFPLKVSSTATIVIAAILLTVALTSLRSSFFSSNCFSYDHSSTFSHRLQFHSKSPPAERSFVASLEKFLKSDARSGSGDDTASVGYEDEAVRALDERMVEREESGVVRVYVYKMPNKFTYDLLRLFQSTYKETENLTSNGSPVHRLIAQHSVDYWLWADLIAPESERLLKNVVRVHRQEEADLFYIPFFTTISYFLLDAEHCKPLYREALKWVTDQPAWKRSEGRDHILPVHHPWSFKTVRKFMKKAIWLLPDMDSTGNWYKPGYVFLEKDVILPYVSNVDDCDSKCLLDSQSQRKTLLYFRGRLKRNAGGKIRVKLTNELRGADGVVIEEGSAGATGKTAAQDGMRRSIFCLSPAGDTPSSARLFDAIVSGCIPVIVSDELELPFEGILDYRKIALFVSSSDAVTPGWLLSYLKSISSSRIKDMQANISKYMRHFRFSSPAEPLGAEDLTWRMIAGKLVNIKTHIRRSQRLVNESRSVCSCECRVSNSTVTHKPPSISRVMLVLYVTICLGSVSLKLKKNTKAAAVIFICRYANSFPKQIRGPD